MAQQNAQPQNGRESTNIRLWQRPVSSETTIRVWKQPPPIGLNNSEACEMFSRTEYPFVRLDTYNGKCSFLNIKKTSYKKLLFVDICQIEAHFVKVTFILYTVAHGHHP